MKWIRNYEELSRRKQLAVGLVNGILAIGLIFLVDQSLGVPLEQSLANVMVTIVVGAVFMLCYRTVMQIRAERRLRQAK